ncbi:MAG TPA: MFS transporter [Actinomycetota bacterium]
MSPEERPARDERAGILGRGPFRMLLGGQAVSSLGDWVGTLAFIAAAYELTGSPAAVGGVLVIRLLPPLLAAPLGGVLADRFDRRRVMVLTNLGMAVLISLAPFAGLALLYAIAFSSEVLAMLFLPARDSTVPDLVPADSLPQANGLVLATSYGAIPFAAALFSGLRLLTPLPEQPLAVPFLFDALTFVVAAVVIARIPIPKRRGGADLRVVEGLGEAYRFARRSPTVRSLAAGMGVAMLGGGVLFAVGIAYVRETLGGGDVEFGYLVSLWGLGMAAGLGGVRLFVRRGEALAFRAAVATCGGALIAMALLPFLWLAFVGALVFGASFAVAIMLAMTLIQRLDEELRGRLVGGAHMLFRVALAIGALGLGGLASGLESVSLVGVDLDGNQIGMAGGGVLILLGAAAASRLTSPDGPPAPDPA